MCIQGIPDPLLFERLTLPRHVCFVCWLSQNVRDQKVMARVMASILLLLLLVCE